MGKTSRTRRNKGKEVVSFDGWINQRLSSFELRKDESTTETLLRVARLWMEPESKPFFYFAERLCFGGAKRSAYRLQFSNLLLQEVMAAMDAGKTDWAKLWLLTFGLLMEQELRTLIDVIHLIENAKSSAETHDEMCTALRKETPYLVLCFYFTKNRARISEWLLKINQTLFQNDCLNSDVAFRRTNIIVADKTRGAREEFYINVSTKLKTLMILYASRMEIAHAPKSYRIVHRGKSIFLSDGGDERRLHQLGVEDNDVIIVIEISNNKEVSDCKQGETKEGNNVATNDIAPRKSSLSRPKRTSSSRSSKTDYSIVIPDRVRHSGLLSRVFEEAESIFAARRQELNALAIKKCNPKQRQSNVKVEKIMAPQFHDVSMEGIGTKPGKICFPISVGDPNFLYRSSKILKSSSKSPITIDLHGCCKSEAIEQLNSLLPVWMEYAMKDHPWTINVTVICGAGSQILSETVEAWIKEKKCVANRFA